MIKSTFLRRRTQAFPHSSPFYLFLIQKKASSANALLETLKKRSEHSGKISGLQFYFITINRKIANCMQQISITEITIITRFKTPANQFIPSVCPICQQLYLRFSRIVRFCFEGISFFTAPPFRNMKGASSTSVLSFFTTTGK